MTKNELVSEITKRTDYTRDVVSEVFEQTLELIKETICAGENIHIRQFGTFQMVQRASKPARDIVRGVTIIVPGKKKPVFKASKHFTDGREGR